MPNSACNAKLPQALVIFSLLYMISPQMYFLSGSLLNQEWKIYLQKWVLSSAKLFEIPFAEIIKPWSQAISQAVGQFQTLLSLSGFFEEAAWLEVTFACTGSP